MGRNVWLNCACPRLGELPRFWSPRFRAPVHCRLSELCLSPFLPLGELCLSLFLELCLSLFLDSRLDDHDFRCMHGIRCVVYSLLVTPNGC